MNSQILLFVISATILLLCFKTNAQDTSVDNLYETINKKAEDNFEEIVRWRRHFHENPELSNRENETAAYIAEFLRSLGLEVKTGVAHTGIVAILEGGKPGPVVGLRADMDALPVRERTDVPFKSEKTTTYLGQEVGVMHACGHDTHMAMLMGAAKILSEMKDELQGTVKFIFQPAEEGAPSGEQGGAEMMVREGVLTNPDVDVIFGQHISSQGEVGTVYYRPRGIMAAEDRFSINVKGKQTHGAYPWEGIDVILTSAKIIEGLQSIISRRTNLTKAAAVISVGTIKAGVVSNIIPEEAEMTGTIRTFDTIMQKKIHEDIRLVAVNIGESMGAEVEVNIKRGVPVTYNDPELTEKMIPVLQQLTGKGKMILTDAVTGAEDFAFFQQQIPGFYFFLGGMPKGMNSAEATMIHTPDLYIEEEGMKLGTKALVSLTLHYMMTSREE